MAKTNWQDPKTGEIISPHISGLQEAVGKIEESIGMNTISETDIPLSEVFISNDDRCRIYQAPEGKRNWLLSPTPSIKKNGVIITDDFEIDYGGGAIIFTTPISEDDTLTADATYTAKIDGNQLSELGNKINQAEQKSKDYTDEQITLVTETGIPKLNIYEYKFYDVPVGTTEIEIPLETFYEATDEVELFINTVPRDSDFFTKVDAVRDENGDLLEKGKVILSNALTDVSKVTIKVWKNIPIGEEGSVSGNIIAIDSIPQNRIQGLNDLNEKVNTIENGKVNKTGDKMTGNLDMDGKNVTIYAPETTGGWSNYFALRNKNNGVEMLFGMRGAGDIVDFSYIGNDTINNHLRFYTDKTQAMKPLEEVFTAISIGSQQEFDDTLNTISDNSPNLTYYKRTILNSVVIPTPMNAGGAWLLEGYKYNSTYQWQRLTGYANNGVIYFRICTASGWSDWSQIVTTRGNVDFSWNALRRPMLEEYEENSEIIGSSFTTLNLSNGYSNNLTIDLSDKASITINGLIGTRNRKRPITIYITQPSTAKPVLFQNITWRDGQIPDLTTPNKMYIITLAPPFEVSKTNMYGIFGGMFDVS